MKILVIAAHPDDEVLGCGGTLYKMSKNRTNKIFIVFAADGVGGRGNNQNIPVRQKESSAVAKLLSAKVLNNFDKDYYRFGDQRIDQEDFNEIVSWAKGKIELIKPEVIYTHFPGDLNRDHQVVAEAVMVATRPNKYEFIKKILCFELNMGSINQGPTLLKKLFNPNVFEKIDLSRKLKLFSLYKSEHKYWKKWQDDIETVAKFRGLGSNYEFAEGFKLVRQRND